MEKLTMLRDDIVKEMEHFADKGKMVEKDYAMLDMLAHTVKNLDKIEMADKYSHNSYDDGNSYARHWVRGHYSRDGYNRDDNYSNDNYSNRRYSRYSRAEAKDSIVNELEELMQDANNIEKEAIRKAISNIKSV